MLRLIATLLKDRKQSRDYDWKKTYLIKGLRKSMTVVVMVNRRLSVGNQKQTGLIFPQLILTHPSTVASSVKAFVVLITSSHYIRLYFQTDKSRNSQTLTGLNLCQARAEEEIGLSKIRLGSKHCPFEIKWKFCLWIQCAGANLQNFALLNLFQVLLNVTCIKPTVSGHDMPAYIERYIRYKKVHQATPTFLSPTEVQTREHSHFQQTSLF